MISIKDYASDSGVSYEAVRKQIKRYREELDGHVRTEGRVQYLDDVAVAFLNEHRSKNPLVVGDSITEREKEQYKADAEYYRGLYETELAERARLSEENSKLHQAQALLAVADQQRHLIEASRDEYKIDAERKGEELDKANKKIMEMSIDAGIKESELERLRAENERLRSRTLFDFIFKRGE